MKFRKKIQIFKGVTLNISTSDISLTVGIKGLNVNISRKGVYLNTSLPGTGLYDRTKIIDINAEEVTTNSKISEKNEKR